MDLTNRE